MASSTPRDPLRAAQPAGPARGLACEELDPAVRISVAVVAATGWIGSLDLRRRNFYFRSLCDWWDRLDSGEQDAVRVQLYAEGYCIDHGARFEPVTACPVCAVSVEVSP